MLPHLACPLACRENLTGKALQVWSLTDLNRLTVKIANPNFELAKTLIGPKKEKLRQMLNYAFRNVLCFRIALKIRMAPTLENTPSTNAKANTRLGFGDVGYALISGSLTGSIT